MGGKCQQVCARRMLQTVQDKPGAFGEAAVADAAAAAAPAGALQERLLGRGVFRRFLEAHVARGAEHYEACASAGFLAAAGSVLRCRLRLIWASLSHPA